MNKKQKLVRIDQSHVVDASVSLTDAMNPAEQWILKSFPENTEKELRAFLIAKYKEGILRVKRSTQVIYLSKTMYFSLRDVGRVLGMLSKEVQKDEQYHALHPDTTMLTYSRPMMRAFVRAGLQYRNLRDDNTNQKFVEEKDEMQELKNRIAELESLLNPQTTQEEVQKEVA